MNVESANELLSSYTDVAALTFTSEPPSWSCTVSVTLFKGAQDGPRLVLSCSDASRLSLSEFGGGLTQVLCLRLRSVAHEGRDRIRFVVEDLERGALWFECHTFSISLPPDPSTESRRLA